MEYGQQMKQSRDNALVGLYQNTGYHFERREKKSVLLDVSNTTTSDMPVDFNVKLLEPLIIDCLSDVYLDSFTTYNAHACHSGLGDKNIGFTLKINEFNNNINVASNQDKTDGGYDSTKFNSIFIPNSNHSSNNTLGISHKMRKFNYVASINPGTISSLSGKILDAGTNLSPAEATAAGVPFGVPLYTTPFSSLHDGVGGAANKGFTARFIAEFMIVARN